MSRLARLPGGGSAPRRGLRTGLLFLLCAVLAACSSGGTSAPSSTPAAPARSSPAGPGGTASADRPCGTSARPPTHYDHVIWVIFENHDADSVLGSASAPYLNRLAGLCASATSYRAVAHPSLPNYIAMTSGSTHGIEDDNAPSEHPVDGPSVFSQAQNWRALQEGMTQPCQWSDTGRYAVKHNPAAYYTGLAGQCSTHDTALGDPPDLSARFTFVTPDLCHDMHDCGVRAGDDWLAGWLPGVLAGPQYRAGQTAVFVTFDEDEGHNDQVVPFLAVAPSVAAGTVAKDDFDHYAMLRTTQEMLGLSPYLGKAATAASMRAALRV